MKIAVICEFSGTVRDAFIKAGHEAISFDIIETEKTGPHVVGDATKIDPSYWNEFDLAICHPPCTYLSYAATRHWNAPGREEKRREALAFFLWCYNLPIDRVCVENPVGYQNSVFRKPDQIIHPYYFGDDFKKRTCLWIRNLPLLQYEKPKDEPKSFYVTSAGKPIHWTEAVTSNRKHVRSKTFPGIAEAMASQWGVTF